MDRFVGGFGVEPVEGAGQRVEQGADAVGVVLGVPGLHGVPVEVFVVGVEPDRRVQNPRCGVRLGGQEVGGEQGVGFDGLLAGPVAVGFDPFVVAAVGQRRAGQVAGLAEQGGAVGWGGVPGLLEQVVELPEVDVDGGGVEPVAGVGSAFDQVAAGEGSAGAGEDVPQVAGVGVDLLCARRWRASGRSCSAMVSVSAPSGWQAR